MRIEIWTINNELFYFLASVQLTARMGSSFTCFDYYILVQFEEQMGL